MPYGKFFVRLFLNTVLRFSFGLAGAGNPYHARSAQLAKRLSNF
jgi:hypothetical protein